MKTITIKARLILVLGTLSVLMVGIGLAGLAGMSGVEKRLETVFEDRLVPMKQLTDINARQQENMRQLLLAGMHDASRPEAALHDHPISMHHDIVQKNMDEIGKTWSAYTATYLTPEEKVLADQFIARRTEFVKEGLLPTIELQKAGRYTEANAHVVKVVNPKYAEASKLNAALVQLQQDVARSEHEAAKVDFKNVVRVAIGVLLVALVVAGLAGWSLVRAIVRPMRAAAAAAESVAAGDLTARIVVERRDEVGTMMEALGHMVERLRTVVGQIRTSTHVVATASSEIAAGNQDLSQRTEEQASSLEETASSMEELTSAVRQNAENAKQANQLAAGATDIAAKGGEVVTRVVSTMNEISESSRKIADIIGVIDGIAFQTNILALNASVEAARAGEQGRGFAVVATEVRNLAQRSAAAAKDIKTLIGDSVGKVEAGSALVDEAGKTMNEVVQAVKRVTDLMAEITAASEEQSSGIEQVNQAIVQMDQVTQQNAALVEEAAAAAESMKQQSGELIQAVSVFKLADADATPAVPTVAAPARSAAENPSPSAWNGAERRGPDRATNVTRARFDARAGKAANKPAALSAPAARTGTDGEWSEF